MTMNIQFNYDKNSLYWENDEDYRLLFCKTQRQHLLDKYYAKGYLHTCDIVCNGFGVFCPGAYSSVVFTVDLWDVNIKFKEQNDYIVVIIEASYKCK